MHGFLLHVNRTSLLKPSDFLTMVIKRSVKIFNEANPGIELITWDDFPGDLHFSYNQNKSLLIVQGYISEVEGFPDYHSQQEACDLMRLHFEANHTCQAFCDIAKRIFGSFSLIFVNLSDLKVFSVSDRISTRPLWYSAKKDEIWLSSNTIPIALSAERDNLNLGHLASYMLYGAPVDPAQSLFCGILCQKEGTLLEHALDDGSAREATWYRFQHRPDTKRTLNSWIKLTSTRLVEASQRVLKTTLKPALFLSGGVDSRIVGSALVAAGGKPVFCTLGDSVNMEMKIARLVARYLKGDHELILRDEEWYLRSIQKAMFNSNGAYSWVHSHFSRAYSILQDSHGIDAAFIGDFCEAFSKLFCNIPMERTSVWKEKEFTNAFDTFPLPNYRPLNRQETLSLLHDDVREEAEKKLNQDIVSRFANLSNISNDPRIVGDYFFRWQSSACLATFQMFNDVRSVGPERNLMFDKGLHQLLEIMPAEIRSQYNFGARLVRKLCPAAANLPNSNTLLPLLFPKLANTFSKKAKPVLGKLRRRLFSDTYRTTASWQHLPLLYCRHAVWKKAIEARLFEDNLLPLHIFSRQAIELCWHRFCNGEYSLHNDIERLFGFAVLSNLLRK